MTTEKPSEFDQELKAAKEYRDSKPGRNAHDFLCGIQWARINPRPAPAATQADGYCLWHPERGWNLNYASKSKMHLLQETMNDRNMGEQGWQIVEIRIVPVGEE